MKVEPQEQKMIRAVRRAQVKDDFRQIFEQTLDAQVDRYLEIDHQEIIGYHHFSMASSECIDVYRDGHPISVNWEDRYHATAVESGDHLARCMVYIDTNMVRAGVVSHPTMWSYCGYNEIQEPRKKNVLIDYDRLQGLMGASSYEQLRSSHKGWVEEYLGDGEKARFLRVPQQRR